MFCTTNPEKIPATIVNRVMRFNLTKIDTNLIRQRLEYICKQEGFTNYAEACDYISKICNGGMRDGISLLEKCANYSSDLKIENVLNCLGDFSYDSFFNLTGSLLNGDEGEVLTAIDSYFNSGKDLKLFIEHYLDFSLDLLRYCIFKNINSVKIPTTLEQRCIGFSSIPDITKWTRNLTNKILNIKNTIKYDVNYKTTIEVLMLDICRGE